MTRKQALYFVIGVSVIFVTLLFLQKEEKQTFYSIKKIHSIYETSSTEQYTFIVYSSVKDSYYFDPAYLVNAYLQGEITEKITINIKSIQVLEEVLYKGEEYYPIVFTYDLGLVPINIPLQQTASVLYLEYLNNQSLSFSIGEFNYLKTDYEQDKLYVHEMSITHDLVDGMNTISGIYITLYNNTYDSVTITDITLLSSSVMVNNYFTKEISDITTIETSIVNALDITEYDYFKETPAKNLSFSILPKQSITLYVPFLYNELIPLNRFCFEIESTVGKVIVDDFLFMNTSFFTEDYHQILVKYD